jgi:membrane protein DedA with SNARE-associated domain
MLEFFINILKDVPWIWVLVVAFLVTYIENIFPPSPSDTVLIFIGTMVSIGDVGFVPLLLVSSLGSTLGFATMFWLGDKFGKKIVDSNRFKFINQESLRAPEEWFRRWGIYLIIANRFLTGTRAVISFFAGMSKLPYAKSLVLSALSALVWNAVLIWLGYIFGNNWELADYYISLYSWIIMPLLTLAVLILLYRWLMPIIRQKKAENSKN